VDFRGKSGGAGDANETVSINRPLTEEGHMSTVAAAPRPVPIPRSSGLRRDPAAHAFVLLGIAFTGGQRSPVDVR
jgi:hypothetical protein